jgi:hypothetical protein
MARIPSTGVPHEAKIACNRPIRENVNGIQSQRSASSRSFQSTRARRKKGISQDPAEKSKQMTEN